MGKERTNPFSLEANLAVGKWWPYFDGMCVAYKFAATEEDKMQCSRDISYGLVRIIQEAIDLSHANERFEDGAEPIQKLMSDISAIKSVSKVLNEMKEFGYHKGERE